MPIRSKITWTYFSQRPDHEAYSLEELVRVPVRYPAVFHPSPALQLFPKVLHQRKLMDQAH